ncbi:MAG: hypothetical protein ACC669_05980 [bacterium]
MKNKLAKDFRNEISTYLNEIKSDLETYIGWAIIEIDSTDKVMRAAEVLEDAIHRLLTISFYLATFFDDADPSQILYELASEISTDHTKEMSELINGMLIPDPPSRTKH